MNEISLEPLKAAIPQIFVPEEVVLVSDNVLMIFLVTTAPLAVAPFKKIPIPAIWELAKPAFVDAVVRLLIWFELITGVPVAVIPRMDASVLLEFKETLCMIFGAAAVPIVPAPGRELRMPLKMAFPVAILNVVPALERLPPVVRFPSLNWDWWNCQWYFRKHHSCCWRL